MKWVVKKMNIKDRARLYIQKLDHLTDEEWEMLLDELEDFLENSNLRALDEENEKNERQQ